MNQLIDKLLELWQSERVMILTVAAVAAQAVIDAVTEGATMATIGKAALLAILGWVARQGVWSQNTLDELNVLEFAQMRYDLEDQHGPEAVETSGPPTVESRIAIAVGPGPASRIPKECRTCGHPQNSHRIGPCLANSCTCAGFAG